MIDKLKVVQTHAKHDKDTGGTHVQIGLLTERITNLAAHLAVNKKDKHGQRGLQLMNGQRRRLLKYLERTNYDEYIALTDQLKIRRGQRIVR